MKMIHLLGRKLKTLGLTIRRCTNWPALVGGKLGLSDPAEIHLRDGFRLKIMRPLHKTWGEIFEPAIADLYGIGQAKPDIVVDVGANIGAFACHAGFIHPRATVHAFEPSKTHRAVLHENIALNDLKNVVVHDHPVTKDGRQVVFSKLGAGGSSGIFLHEGRDSAETLQSVSLDRVEFSGFKNAFVKLDCEGAEGEIIEWLCANRERLSPYLQLACEYHPWCPVPLEESLNTLRAHGFSAEAKVMFDEPYLFASLDRASAPVRA